MRLPAAVQVPWNSCHSLSVESDSEVCRERLHAVIASRLATAITKRDKTRSTPEGVKRRMGSPAPMLRRDVNQLDVAPTSVTVMVSLLVDYRTTFASTNPMSTDDTVATMPGSMKLWLSTYLPIFVVPV